jgi:hypothetical protein
MVKLKARFRPTDEIQKQELIAKWKALQKPPRQQNLLGWLQKWETTFDKCKEVNLADVQGTRLIYDFVATF